MTSAYAQLKAHQAVLGQRRQYLIGAGGFWPERALSYWPARLAAMRSHGLEPVGVSGAWVYIDDSVNVPLRPEPRLLDVRKLARVRSTT